jgi:hypothetical protein
MVVLMQLILQVDIQVLLQGLYITAQNAAGCISADANATVTAAPATPAAPTLNVTQPTCAVATGTITITSPTAGLTFSVNGGAYAAYPAGGYTGLAAGPYTITAQNAAGCISADANATVNAAPATPAAPTLLLLPSQRVLLLQEL